MDTSRPFTRQQALESGITDDALAGPRYQRIFRDAYVDARTDVGLRIRAEAALLLQSGPAMLSHTTAAQLLGLPVRHDPDVHVLVRDKNGRRRREGLRTHHGSFPDSQHRIDNLPVTSPVETLIRLSTMTPLVDLVACGDTAIRLGLTTLVELAAAVESRTDPGIRVTRRAVSLMRDGTDAPTESRTRLLLVLAGLPEPVVNYTIRAENGDVLHRIDLAYPQWRVAVEYDGRHHQRQRTTYLRDMHRREALERAGWTVIVVVAEDLYQRPEQVIARVCAALADAGAAPALRRPTSAWQRHFAA